MSERRINLAREAQTSFVVGTVDGFRFKVTASDGNLIDNEIFLYYRRPLNPITGLLVDEFSSVCSAVDMEEYPVGAPIVDADPPMFRKAQIDLVFRSQTEADTVWNNIQAEVDRLITSLDTMDVLGAAEDNWIPDPP